MVIVKKWRFIEYAFFALLINLVSFFLRPMTWTMLSGTSAGFCSQAVWESFSNWLLFVATVFVIALLFRAQDNTISFRCFSIRFLKKMVFPAVVIRLLTDGIHLAINLLNFVYADILVLALEVLSLFAIFVLVKNQISPSKMRLTVRRKAVVFCGIIALVVFIVLHAYSSHMASATAGYILDKFVDSSFLHEADTYGFKLQVINVGFSIALWMTLFACFDPLGNSSRQKITGNRLAVRIVRYCCLVVFLLLSIRVKILVLPHGTFLEANKTQMQTTSYSEEKHIQSDFCTIVYSRKANYNEAKTVYKNTNVTLLYGNDEVLSFNRMVNRESGKLHKIDIPETAYAYRYEFDAIVYVKDGVPFAITFEDVNDYDTKDDVLIAICESLISEGHFEALEYSYKYLLRYDQDFIAPYVEMCLKGALSEFSVGQYAKQNEHIQPSYIATFAKEIVLSTQR